MGIERITMLRYQIGDLRHFFENDRRFLDQFAGDDNVLSSPPRWGAYMKVRASSPAPRFSTVNRPASFSNLDGTGFRRELWVPPANIPLQFARARRLRPFNFHVDAVPIVADASRKGRGRGVAFNDFEVTKQRKQSPPGRLGLLGCLGIPIPRRCRGPSRGRR